MEGEWGLAERIPARLSRAEGRKFAFTVGAGLLALASVGWWRGHGSVASLLGFTGFVLAAAGIVVPSRLAGLRRAWMRLARAISKITTPVAMGVVYFIVIAPVGLVMRLFGRNPLERRRENGSFWIARSAGSVRRGKMTNQF